MSSQGAHLQAKHPCTDTIGTELRAEKAIVSMFTGRSYFLAWRIFVVLAGLIGVAASVLSVPESSRRPLFLALTVVGASLLLWISGTVVANKFRGHKYLPDADELLKSAQRYSIVPAEETDLAWMAGLEAAAFSTDDAVPVDVLLRWFKKNPNSFNVVATHEGSKIGHINVLPVKPDSLGGFREGSVKETALLADSIFSYAERNSVEDVYVESVVIKPSRTISLAPAMAAILSNFSPIVERIAEITTLKHVHAIAASQRGDKLLKKLGFSCVKPATQRADRHDFYSISFELLSKKIVELTRERVNDLTKLEHLAEQRLGPEGTPVGR